MAKSFFTDLATKAFRAGVTPRTDASRRWFQGEVRNIRNINRRKLLKDPALEPRNRARVGSMYMYFYNPKHEATLPYYDLFPLTIMVQPVPGGFHGLNLHYLPPALRARLFDSLVDLTNNKKYDESTRFKLTYDLLKSASKMRFFKPCYKHYLYSQIEGRVAMVEAPAWEMALFLPTEQFRKSTKTAVWKDSREAIRG
mgnify:CR=1 FL=1|jgi:hypothetical protein